METEGVIWSQSGAAIQNGCKPLCCLLCGGLSNCPALLYSAQFRLLGRNPHQNLCMPRKARNLKMFPTTPVGDHVWDRLEAQVEPVHPFLQEAEPMKNDK